MLENHLIPLISIIEFYIHAVQEVDFVIMSSINSSF